MDSYDSDREAYIASLVEDYYAQWEHLQYLYDSSTQLDDLEEAEAELERLEDLLMQEGISP